VVSRRGALGVRGIAGGVDSFALFALAAHLALALSLRATAWPEVTTPGYLWSRGMLMYRDIKLQHTPATAGTLAILFLIFGSHTWLIRCYAVVWPLLAHIFLLRETRAFPLWNRAVSSGFFLAVYFSTDGNAVWPTVVMTALAIPIARALSRGHVVQAGLLLGLAILFKQTAAYALILAVAWLIVQRRFRASLSLFGAACVPYFVTLAGFFILGAGVYMLRWTIQVPFTIHTSLVTFRPSFGTAFALLLGFVPLAVEAAVEKPGEYVTSARWLLVIAFGLALISYPRFQVLQTVASVPCLAVGAGRLMNRRPRLLSCGAFAFAAAMMLSRGAIFVLGNEFDGKIRFWNEEPAFNALIDRLRQMPRTTPLYSELWGNVHPRAEMIPPGRIYQHPWFDFFFGVDQTGERIRRANAQPGTVIVGYRGSGRAGETVGPYVIVRR
jgi:hypothetical protein